MPNSIEVLAQDIEAQKTVLADALPVLRQSARAMSGLRADTTWITGCGDGTFAGQAVTELLAMPTRAIRATAAAELLWHVTPRAGDTVIALSVSGGTKRTVEAAQRARDLGAHVIAVTLNAQSPLGQVSHQCLMLPYTPISRAIPHCLDYTMLLLALLVLGEVPKLDAATNALGLWLDEEEARAAAAVAQSGPSASVFALGSGPALGSAGFAAAKLQEAAGFRAWALESENVAHGPHLMMRPGDIALLLGGGAGDHRTAALRPGLEKIGLVVADTGLAQGMPAIKRLFRATFLAQAMCLHLSARHASDVMRPEVSEAVREVQADWFAWTGH